MKPITLFLLDPLPSDVESSIAESRVAAVFISAEKRQAVRLAFAAKAKAGELIELDAENLAPFARGRCSAPPRGQRDGRMLVDAALAFLGVPRTVVVTSDDLFDVVADVLRQEARLPKSLRFKGWPEGRRRDLAKLGFTNVAAIGTPPGDDGADLDEAGATRAMPADPLGGCTFHAWR